jgi:hypothetical protein
MAIPKGESSASPFPIENRQHHVGQTDSLRTFAPIQGYQAVLQIVPVSLDLELQPVQERQTGVQGKPLSSIDHVP